MAKKKYSYKFRKSKKTYEFKKSINYQKGKVNFEFVVGIKNNDQGTAGLGFTFWDVDIQNDQGRGPLSIRSLLVNSNEFDIYRKMYTYGKVNGILIESIPSAANSSSITYKAPVQIQTSFTNEISYNNALILNPYNYCKQYIKSYETDYWDLHNLTNHEIDHGLISLLAAPTTVTQGYGPLYTLRVSVYMSFKKNSNV